MKVISDINIWQVFLCYQTKLIFSHDWNELQDMFEKTPYAHVACFMLPCNMVGNW